MTYDFHDTLAAAAANLADGDKCFNCGHPIGFHMFDPDRCIGATLTSDMDGGCECCWFTPVQP